MSAVDSPFRLARYQCPHCKLRFDRAFAHPTLGTVCPICVRHIEVGVDVEIHAENISPRARIVRASRKTLSKIQRLAERDGWDCHLCRQPIDPRARGSRGPSLDHVIPKSLGGPSSLNNLKLAHAGCNHKRGNRLLQPQETA